MIPTRIWFALGFALACFGSGFASGRHWAQGAVISAQVQTKAAQAEANSRQIKYELCSASVVQWGQVTKDARAKQAEATAALSAQEPARAVRTVTVVRRIQESNTCNAALLSAWQSAPR